MSTSFRFALVAVMLAALLSGCFPGTVLRCEVFEANCDWVDSNSYVYLRPQNFGSNPILIKRGGAKDLTVLLTGSSDVPDNTFDLNFRVLDHRGFSVEGISIKPSLLSVRAGSSQTLWVNVSPDVKPGLYQGQMLATKDSIYAVLDISIAVPH